jgi:hypothetical protein
MEEQILSIANEKIQNFLDNLLKELKSECINNMYRRVTPLSRCPFRLISGNRRGQECGIALNQNEQYCKRHTLRSDPPVEEDDVKTEIIERNVEEAILIRRNQFNNFVYKDYIFKSPTEKYIVAKEGLNGEWLPLTEEDKMICRKKYKLRYKDIVFTKKPSFDKSFIKEQIKLPYEQVVNDEIELDISPHLNNMKIKNEEEVELDLSNLSKTKVPDRRLSVLSGGEVELDLSGVNKRLVKKNTI